MKKLTAIILTFALIMVGCSTTPSQQESTSQPALTTESTTQPATTSQTQATTAASSAQTTQVDTLSETSQTVRVVAPYGAPLISLLKMINDQEVYPGIESIEYDALAATDALTATLINGEADIAIIPSNLAAILYSKDVKYQIGGVSVWGLLYLISDQPVQIMDDLKGREIALFGQNATPDALFRYLLAQYGIDAAQDVTLSYYSGATEIAAGVAADKISTAVVAEPMMTALLKKNPIQAIQFDLNDLWQEATGFENYPQAVIVFSNDLIAERPEFVESFLDDYQSSISWLNENRQQAGVYYEKLAVGLNAEVIEEAIERSHLDFVATEQAKPRLAAYYDVLYQFNPKLVGGQPVDEALYYIK